MMDILTFMKIFKEGDEVLVSKGTKYELKAVILSVNPPIFSNSEITYTCASGTTLFTVWPSDLSEISAEKSPK
jgi:hypothetical protein